jgi:antagonist of KipI
MDGDALQVANLLAGNEPGAAALESVWEGPTIEALADCWVGIAGAATLPRKNGEMAPNPGRVRLAKGDVLRVGRVVHGLHVYVALSGGIAADRFLGSAATYVPAQVGGIAGNVVRKGTVLCRGTADWREPRSDGRLPAAFRVEKSHEPLLRALPGPHAGLFRTQAMKELFSSALSFTPRSDRTGLRLAGIRLPLKQRISLTSFGVVRGALQVPPTGEPILLAADAHTIGGYPVAAVVIQADMAKLAQIQPGDPFRLQRVLAEEALEANEQHRAWLGSVARYARGEGLFAAWDEIHEMLALPGTNEASFASRGISVRVVRGESPKPLA